MTESLESKVGNRIAEIFEGKSFVMCSYIGKNIVKGFDGYMDYLGIQPSPIRNGSEGLFDADILSYTVKDGPLAEESICDGANLIADAVREYFGMDPFRILKPSPAGLDEKIVTMHQKMSLLVFKLAMQKNFEALGAQITANHESEPNVDLSGIGHEISVFSHEGFGCDPNLYFNRN